MFPEVPQDRSNLTATELRSLASQIRDAVKAQLAAEPDAEALKRIRQAREMGKLLTAEAEAREIADEVEAEETAEAEAAATPEATDEPDPDVDDDDDDVDVDVDDDDVEEVPVVSASARPAKVRTTVGAGASSVPAVLENGRNFSDQLRAVDAVNGKSLGQPFDDWTDFSAALIEKARQIKSNTSEKFAVGRIQGRFDPSQEMSENPLDNLHLFEREEIMAALCAPLPPTYDLACMNTTRRPVKASLPTRRAPRGGMKIYPSPTLEDITTGTGIWTHEDDADDEAVKEACATIECATPVDYRWYGIYRCITIKNMLAMTFPELVEAYLNRLGAAFSRMAEIQLLEAMATETDTLQAHTLGYNASVSITSNILNYLALYREQQRWDDQEFDAWMPRWVVPALQADQIRRRNTNGDVLRVPTESQIRQVFVDAGVTPHFFLDTPSWATPIPALQVTGNLGWFTRNLEMIVAPRGKFQVMDEGNLTIGVTGNNIYRDNESNRRNQFTMFWESFEGVLNTDSCPAHLLVMDNLCFNGQQIADVVINCEGGDEVGAAS